MGYRTTIARYVAKAGIAEMFLCETKCQRSDSIAISRDMGPLSYKQEVECWISGHSRKPPTQLAYQTWQSLVVDCLGNLWFICGKTLFCVKRAVWKLHNNSRGYPKGPNLEKKQSLLNFSFSLENFNLPWDFQSRPSEFLTEIGVGWVARLEIFNPAIKTWILSIFGPWG